jgi:hypothetical protein
VRIKKGMYGLKQAALLAYNNLVTNLAQYGYCPIPHTIGLCQHDTKQTKFCLCVNDFGIKYYNDNDRDHLLNALRDHYTITVDTTGKKFCGLTFDWNYKQGYVDVSMPDYIPKVLKKFQHSPPTKPQHCPFPATPFHRTSIGIRQYAKDDDKGEILPTTEITKVQSIVGSLLYYARAIDNSILPALNTISARQASPTATTMNRCKQLMDFVATHPNVYIRYYASAMQLQIDSDAAYLVEPHARSRIAGCFQLTNAPPRNIIPNGAILIECKTLRHVVASSAEAETAGIFHNAQISMPIRYVLKQLGHPQQATPLKTDNSTAASFVHDNITQKKSKSWDMRFYWLRDRQTNKDFKIFWEKGETNHADYFTKHHTSQYHQDVRSRYVKDNTQGKIRTIPSSADLQGCVGTDLSPRLTRSG